MSVSLNPREALCFQKPLTTGLKETLIVTNDNAEPVAFKVKTTAPKRYAVRPNFARLEPGGSVAITVILHNPSKEPGDKLPDKFLIQSTIITADRAHLALQDIAWENPDESAGRKIFQQKLRVEHLPAEGEEPEEIDAPAPEIALSPMLENDEKSPDAESIVTRCKKSAGVPREIMRVSLNPGSALFFQRPLTRRITQMLTITNNNVQPIAYKVKTTAPKIYYARPYIGKVKPGESFSLLVTKRESQDEPPAVKQSTDKFLIQCIVIPPEQEHLSVEQIWASPRAKKEENIYGQKLRVTYVSSTRVHFLAHVSESSKAIL
ncbi:hypothetical protein HYPSUDRAFT_91939 [Hypholoma sublateritium FD-334 SS-4]|uniref:MSP domain-containing protein n=1 Tax=Hypholoma sublateritium (strain FD-334 SS-4) TaxID=945553 RepID=A0A0D2LX14_HYPSF|nr:hypothetical protein HYPSUDRAFT_91939 [Hypholoma sublateritium FD-334 SS-4]